MYSYDETAVRAAREALMDYYGTAASSGMPAAHMELAGIPFLSDEEALRKAQELGLI